MKRPQLVRVNKWFALALCCVLAASVVYLSGPAKTVYAAEDSTLRGKPIIKKDGKTMLWAGVDPKSKDTKWWDVTDALVDPRRFDHGLGADRIPSIDAPQFAAPDDPRFGEGGLPGDTEVIGVEVDGEARAYPIRTMNRHELVNDTFGEAHMTVAW